MVERAETDGRGWLFAGALAGGLGVALGAFGAHGLEGRVDPGLLEVWVTASKYHLVHAVALLVLGCVGGRIGTRGRGVAGVGFVVGIVVFSGSLYLMTLTGQRWLGAVTPLGGVAFLIGWFTLAGAALKK